MGRVRGRCCRDRRSAVSTLGIEPAATCLFWLVGYVECGPTDTCLRQARQSRASLGLSFSAQRHRLVCPLGSADKSSQHAFAQACRHTPESGHPTCDGRVACEITRGAQSRSYSQVGLRYRDSHVT